MPMPPLMFLKKAKAYIAQLVDGVNLPKYKEVPVKSQKVT